MGKNFRSKEKVILMAFKVIVFGDEGRDPLNGNHMIAESLLEVSGKVYQMITAHKHLAV